MLLQVLLVLRGIEIISWLICYEMMCVFCISNQGENFTPLASFTKQDWTQKIVLKKKQKEWTTAKKNVYNILITHELPTTNGFCVRVQPEEAPEHNE